LAVNIFTLSHNISKQAPNINFKASAITVLSKRCPLLLTCQLHTEYKVSARDH